MFCIKCGANLPEEAGFCVKCGNEVEEDGRKADNVQPNNKQGDFQQGYSQTITQNQQFTQQNTHGYVANLKSDRSLLKYILLSLVTFGIYSIMTMCEISTSLNTIATRYDGKNTKNYFSAMLIGCITFGIYPIIWFHNTSKRVGDELNRRNLNVDFGSKDFWLWNGAFIFVGYVVGFILAEITGMFFLTQLVYIFPFVYLYKLINAMNTLSVDYNQKG